MIVDCDACNATTARTEKLWWLIEWNIVVFLFENVNYVLIEFIEFNEYEIRIDSNFSRSIIRAKRIYKIFYYKKNLFREIVVSFVCIIVTFSFIVELNFKQILHFIRCDIVRVNNDRFNFQYCVQTISSSNNRSFKNINSLINETIKICMQNIDIWKTIVFFD